MSETSKPLSSGSEFGWLTDSEVSKLIADFAPTWLKELARTFYRQGRSDAVRQACEALRASGKSDAAEVVVSAVRT